MLGRCALPSPDLGARQLLFFELAVNTRSCTVHSDRTTAVPRSAGLILPRRPRRKAPPRPCCSRLHRPHDVWCTLTARACLSLAPGRRLQSADDRPTPASRCLLRCGRLTLPWTPLGGSGRSSRSAFPRVTASTARDPGPTNAGATVCGLSRRVDSPHLAIWCDRPTRARRTARVDLHRKRRTGAASACRTINACSGTRRNRRHVERFASSAAQLDRFRQRLTSDEPPHGRRSDSRRGRVYDTSRHCIP